MRRCVLLIGCLMVSGVLLWTRMGQAFGGQPGVVPVRVLDPDRFVGVYAFGSEGEDALGRMRISRFEDRGSPAFGLPDGLRGVEGVGDGYVSLTVWQPFESMEEDEGETSIGCFVRGDGATYFVGMDRDAWFLGSMTMRSLPVWRAFLIDGDGVEGLVYKACVVQVVWTGAPMAGRFAFDASVLASGEEAVGRARAGGAGAGDPLERSAWFGLVDGVADAVSYYDGMPDGAWIGVGLERLGE